MNISDREKRTIRLAGGALAVFLVLYGFLGVQRLARSRDEERQASLEALQEVETTILRRARDAKRYLSLAERHRLDFDRLDSPNLITDVRVAIEQAARTAGVTLGPTRENSGTGAVRATLDFESKGGTSELLDFVHRLRTLGYPLVIDRFGLEVSGPAEGTVSLTLSLRTPEAGRPS